MDIKVQNGQGNALTVVSGILSRKQKNPKTEHTARTIESSGRRKEAEKAQITVTVEGRPAPVYGQRKLLEELVFNLCDNAIRYNRPGGFVTMRSHFQDGQAILVVSDTGIGIAKNEQERIFERFYRVDKSHSRIIGGTGLGLSIVKHGVQLHQGDISLESQPDKGTAITVRLPITL